MLKLDNISFSYKKELILKNFSLEIEKGDAICLFGESGCGKTTVLRIIEGLEKVKSGKIIKDENLKLSVVFQENRLLPFKTVLENIMLIGADKEFTLKNLYELGIYDCKDLYPESLSGGMQRRVAIARALSVDFDILILDEAFNGLDKANILKAINRIKIVSKGRSVIMVTHSEEEAKLMNCKIHKM